jgi:3-oxoacyl-[acyl-carrier-protein] synthase II
MTNSNLDAQGRPVIVVTGMGVVTSLGQGQQDNWRDLIAGKSGIRHITRFSTEGLRTTIAGCVDFLDVDPYSAPALSIAMAESAASEAIEQANIGTKGDFPGPLFLATPPTELEWPQRRELYAEESDTNLEGYDRLLSACRATKHEEMQRLFQFASVGEHLADKYGTKGLPISLSTACASGGTAIQLGVEAIRRGDTDTALCVGTDGTVNLEALVRFSLLSALSTRNDPPEGAMASFSKDRDGFIMAEGAACLVLESYERAKARGAKILGVVMGCGEHADDFHRTRTSPDGMPMIRTITKAIEDAGLKPEDIDYVNAHGTSTPENDKMEFFSLGEAFGDVIKTMPVSSNKSMIGHTLSAAGAVEAVFSLLTMSNSIIPPTINYNTPDPEIEIDAVPNKAREADVRAVISNSFGFGGQNVSVVYGREPK